MKVKLLFRGPLVFYIQGKFVYYTMYGCKCQFGGMVGKDLFGITNGRNYIRPIR